MKSPLLTSIAISLVLIGLVFFARKKRTQEEPEFEVYDTNKLNLDDLISWFKKEINTLHNKENLEAVLLKLDSKVLDSIRDLLTQYTEITDYSFKFVQGIMDSSSGKLLVMRIIRANVVEDIINEQFGEKNVLNFK